MRPLSEDDLSAWRAVAESVKPLPGRAGVLSDRPPEPKPAAPSLSAPTMVRNVAPSPITPLDPRISRSLRRGKLQPDAGLDLHGFTEAQAHGAVVQFILAHRRRRSALLLVITGKGDQRTGGGVLRRLVPLWLQSDRLRPHILSIASAAPGHGGEGAFYVRLRRAAVQR
jgi:DNA-nicking Smr family endonuclease